MTKNITQDNLIRYIYQETSQEESSLIEEALATDYELKELYESLLESKSELDKVRISPPQDVVDKIMEYSSKTAPHEHAL